MRISLHHSSFHKLLHKKKFSFGHRIGRNAYLDWKLSIIMTGILVVAFVGVGVWKYHHTLKVVEGWKPASSTTRVTIFDEKALATALQILDRRESERSALKRGYSGPGDPAE